jgi:hypothetical protein
MKSLIANMAKFQKDVPVIPKNKVNSFFSKGGTISKYADLAGVIDTCKPILNRHGLIVVQTMFVSDGHNCLRTILADSSGETMSSEMVLPDIADPQKLTAAVTYLRRCQYLAIVGLVADEDDDGNSVGHQQEPRATPPRDQPREQQTPPHAGGGEFKANDKQKNLIKMLVEKTGVDVTPEQIASLTSKQASAWIDKLKEKEKELATKPEQKSDIPW